uniref:Uncharacterized protein n=1 Tax=Panagrolaimus superbus TaxID=310955 RepID=A0A914YIB4_9BILA
MRLAGREQVDVATGGDTQRAIRAGGLGSGQIDIAVCPQHHVVASQQLAAAHGLITLADLQRTALAACIEVAAAAVHQHLAVDIAAGLQGHAAIGRDAGRSQVDVLARCQHHIAGALNRSHRVRGLAVAGVVAAVVVQRAALAQRLCAEGPGCRRLNQTG